jgi:carbonic anhydrase
MTVTDEFLTNNESYAAGFGKGDLAMPPAKHVAVLACMDARLDPARALGLEEGDAHVTDCGMRPGLRLRREDGHASRSS